MYAFLSQQIYIKSCLLSKSSSLHSNILCLTKIANIYPSGSNKIMKHENHYLLSQLKINI